MANDPREHSIHPRDAARADAARAEAIRADARADAARADAARAEAARAQAARAEAARDQLHVRPAPEYRPRRRRWPGVLAAAVIGAVIAGVMVSNYYSESTVGERLDSVVERAGEKVQQGAQDVRTGAAAVADQSAQAGAQVAGSLVQNVDDSRITTAVKTSLAADPTLSALRINVTTKDGVVTLEGPAPDEKGRERAAVLAAAPNGVTRVENRLVVKTN
jgi:hyperosmotically inducible protein